VAVGLARGVSVAR